MSKIYLDGVECYEISPLEGAAMVDFIVIVVVVVFVIAAILNFSTVNEEERRHVIERYFRVFYEFLCVFY